MIPTFLRQLRNEDYFVKRELPPTARPYREEFHAETKVAAEQQPPKATEAAARRRLRLRSDKIHGDESDGLDRGLRRRPRTDICFWRAASVPATPWPAHSPGRHADREAGAA